jgi:iron complex outermembrane receptor protein
MKPKHNTIIIFISIICILISLSAFNQESKVQNKIPTKEEILNMSYEQLLNMPFQDLINLADVVGVSTEELLEMILNKDVSSASKSKEKVLQSPLSTTVISKEELDKSGATSIAEALRLVPGMIVREKTPGNFDIHIRGNDNVPPKNLGVYSEDALTLVMIDNRPVYNYAFGGTFWETLPVDINDVDRIEVIRGPSSALYGPNAVAGVINIITIHPENNKLTATGNFQEGTRNTTLANLGIAGGISKKLRIRVSGNYQHRERFQNNFYDNDSNKYFTYQQLVKDSLITSGQIVNPNVSMDKYAGNIFLYYDINKDINIDLTGGGQRSEVLTTGLGKHPIPYTGRQSHTEYLDLKSKIYNFNFQCNYMFGNQQIERGDPAWHISPKVFTSMLEYEYKIDKLTLRPGISYQQADYSDQDYVNTAARAGFLNGNKELNGMAGYIRGDYKPTEKLRLIAALRADKYNVPDKTYFTYQFIATYNLNQNNVLRAVYSRANRGPFMVDSYANYNWVNAPGFPLPTNLQWDGNRDLNLPVMDMFELGFRTKIADRVMVDLEAFYTNMKNYSYFIPDSFTLTMNWAPLLNGTGSSAPNATGYISYHNFDLQSDQIGITCNVSVVINNSLNFRVFGTLQNTWLKNFYPNNFNEDFNTMLGTDYFNFESDLNNLLNNKIVPGNLNPNGTKTYFQASPFKTTPLVNETNNSTPGFYGGAAIDYSPVKKLNIYSMAYFYSKQSIETYEIDQSNTIDPSTNNNTAYMYHIEPKIIIDAKVSYKFWKENRIFFNARNLFNNNKREFAYTDNIGGTYLIGVTLIY